MTYDTIFPGTQCESTSLELAYGFSHYAFRHFRRDDDITHEQVVLGIINDVTAKLGIAYPADFTIRHATNDLDNRTSIGVFFKLTKHLFAFELMLSDIPNE
jgi:hypothetical protein